MSKWDQMTPQERQAHERRVAAQREKIEQEMVASIRVKERRGYTSLPDADWETCRFEKLMICEQNREVVECLQVWNPNITTKGALLYGDVGTGKSMLCKCLINKWASMTYRCYFIDVPKLLHEMKEQMSLPDGNPQSIVDRMLGYDMLVLDDLGTEKSSEWSYEQLFTIFDNRSRRGRHTFFTSNLSLDRLRDKYGARIIDRINMACRSFEMNGSSFRELLSDNDAW